jgi:tRNA threonylcarbamoyladenosine biosynthesis protein TsaB
VRPWLAVDSATDHASVAVAAGSVLAERSWLGGRHHTVQLAAAVADALDRAGLSVADLEGIAVAIGPGSYTGLRVGLALVKGMALVAATPVVGVPTLHSLAAALSPPVTERTLPLHAMLRAGRGRHAVATYPADTSAWPGAKAPRAWTLSQWLAAHSPPGWVAGELGQAELESVRAAGFLVPPPAAHARRAAYLIDLARGLPRVLPAELPLLAPIYLAPSPTASSAGGPA